MFTCLFSEREDDAEVKDAVGILKQVRLANGKVSGGLSTWKEF